MKTGACHSSCLPRLKKIEGQVKGISKMIEEKRYCVDLLVQLKAVKSAIRSVELKVLEGHLNSCLQKAWVEKDEEKGSEIIKELIDTLKKST